MARRRARARAGCGGAPGAHDRGRRRLCSAGCAARAGPHPHPAKRGHVAQGMVAIWKKTQARRAGGRARKEGGRERKEGGRARKAAGQHRKRGQRAVLPGFIGPLTLSFPASLRVPPRPSASLLPSPFLRPAFRLSSRRSPRCARCTSASSRTSTRTPWPSLVPSSARASSMPVRGFVCPSLVVHGHGPRVLMVANRAWGCCCRRPQRHDRAADAHGPHADGADRWPAAGDPVLVLVPAHQHAVACLHPNSGDRPQQGPPGKRRQKENSP